MAKLDYNWEVGREFSENTACSVRRSSTRRVRSLWEVRKLRVCVGDSCRSLVTDRVVCDGWGWGEGEGPLKSGSTRTSQLLTERLAKGVTASGGAGEDERGTERGEKSSMLGCEKLCVLWDRKKGRGQGEGRGAQQWQGNRGLRRFMAAYLLYRKKYVLKRTGTPPSPASGHQQWTSGTATSTWPSPQWAESSWSTCRLRKSFRYISLREGGASSSGAQPAISFWFSAHFPAPRRGGQASGRM